jgi:hypothetical protein
MSLSMDSIASVLKVSGQTVGLNERMFKNVKSFTKSFTNACEDFKIKSNEILK